MILNLCVTVFLYSAPCSVLYHRFPLYKYSIIIIIARIIIIIIIALIIIIIIIALIIIIIIIVCAAFGGIYLDTDEVLLQPMDDLLQHHVTMAWEKNNRSFGNGLLLAEPRICFVVC